MNVWTIVLLGLCAAGALLALAGAILVISLLVVTFKRLKQFQESSFVTKLESLQIQIDRLSRIPAEVEPLQTRLDAAVKKIRESFDATSELRVALATCAGEARAIIAELS